MVNQYSAHSFARNWQRPFLNQWEGENDPTKECCPSSFRTRDLLKLTEKKKKKNSLQDYWKWLENSMEMHSQIICLKISHGRPPDPLMRGYTPSHTLPLSRLRRSIHALNSQCPLPTPPLPPSIFRPSVSSPEFYINIDKKPIFWRTAKVAIFGHRLSSEYLASDLWGGIWLPKRIINDILTSFELLSVRSISLFFFSILFVYFIRALLRFQQPFSHTTSGCGRELNAHF